MSYCAGCREESGTVFFCPNCWRDFCLHCFRIHLRRSRGLSEESNDV